MHLIASLIAIGYAQDYYFHLRELRQGPIASSRLTRYRPPQEQRSLVQRCADMVGEREALSIANVDI